MSHPLSDAIRDVIAERVRQQHGEGWTPEHDDRHTTGELALAAAAYAVRAHAGLAGDLSPPGFWPWQRAWWKLAAQRRMLVKAAALVIAEIERIDRAREKREAAPSRPPERPRRRPPPPGGWVRRRPCDRAPIPAEPEAV